MQLKPVWTSATFLEYAGILGALAATVWLLDELQGQQGSGALVGWSALFLVAAGTAARLSRRRDPIVAGLFALVALAMFSTFVGALFDLAGILPEGGSSGFFLDSVEWGLVLLLLIVLVAALVLMGRYGFPLLALAATLVVWYLLIHFLGALSGGGGDADAAWAIVVGLLLVARGTSLDRDGKRPSAFWLHFVGGASVGGGIVWFVHSEDWHWALVAAVALGYIAVSRSLGRSSYAVLGALGLLASTTWFVQERLSLGSVVPLFPSEPSTTDRWARPFVYLTLGLAVAVLGGWVGRRRRTEPAP